MVLVENREELVWQEHVLLNEVDARGSAALELNLKNVTKHVLAGEEPPVS